MKNVIILAIALIFCSTTCFAQVDVIKILDDAMTDMRAGKLNEAQTKLQFADGEAQSVEEKILVATIVAQVDQLQGNEEKAINSLTAIFEDENTPPGSRYTVAIALSAIFESRSQKEENKKLEILEKALTFTQDNSSLLSTRQKMAEVFLRRKQPELAQQTLSKMLDVKNIELFNLASTYIALAELQLDQRKFELARTEYSKVLALDTTKLGKEDAEFVNELKDDAKLGIANSYFKEGDSKMARQQYTELLADKELTKDQRQEATEQLVAIVKAEEAKMKPNVTP